MIRPLAAMGEVHWRTPEQLFVLVKTAAPVSPSTPLRLPLFMYQTITLLVPSVVVEIGPVTAPTLVIWGERDRYLGPTLAEPHHDDVPNLERVERLPDASHWVHHDEAERVNQLLIDFFAPARAAST